MFKFIQQLVSSADRLARPTTRRSERRRQEAWDPAKSIRGLEVLEGNDDTDWDLWECSVHSELQPLATSVRIKGDATPSRLDDFDPFARVSKNSDL
jgi:hypothetical protein